MSLHSHRLAGWLSQRQRQIQKLLSSRAFISFFDCHRPCLFAQRLSFQDKNNSTNELQGKTDTQEISEPQMQTQREISVQTRLSVWLSWGTKSRSQKLNPDDKDR
ncbi:hypothetical protein NE237_020859 [Protea cynaroides]|uniref:Uncharacterized protein n=1 Tax=Protea cynaroides TaxID=273540 RepID=A0A9Q0K224_9MAGN|nr:hypothetical protein NE237_020859 [Protea cynaroides]